MITSESSLRVFFMERFNSTVVDEKCVFLEILETIAHKNKKILKTMHQQRIK